MSVTIFTAFQPKLKGVCPKGVGPTPSEYPYPDRGGGRGGDKTNLSNSTFFCLETLG